MLNQTTIVTDVLKKHVVDKALNKSISYAKTPKRNLSPSMDFLCIRKTFFNFKYSGGAALDIDPRDITYEGERAKQVGNEYHAFLEKQFTDAGILVLSEFTLEDEDYHIKARIDFIVEINKKLYLIEAKSAKSYSVKIMKEESSPDIEHQKQIQMYFHLLDHNKDLPELKTALKGRAINQGMIFYESKNDHKPLEFIINKNNAIIQELLDFARIVWDKKEKNQEPKQKFEPDSVECLYKCKAQFYELCHGKPNPIKETIVDEGVWGFGNVKPSVTKEPKFV